MRNIYRVRYKKDPSRYDFKITGVHVKVHSNSLKFDCIRVSIEIYIVAVILVCGYYGTVSARAGVSSGAVCFQIFFGQLSTRTVTTHQ